MTREKWEYITGDVEDKFGLLEKGREFFDESGGINVDFIVFKSPLGKIRLEYAERPVILDKKTNYSHRAGTIAEVEYVYSKTEKTASFTAYKWVDGENDWKEIGAENLF